MASRGLVATGGSLSTASSPGADALGTERLTLEPPGETTGNSTWGGMMEGYSTVPSGLRKMAGRSFTGMRFGLGLDIFRRCSASATTLTLSS